MRVLVAPVNFQLCENAAAKTIVWNHPFDGVFNEKLRTALTSLLHGFRLVAPHVTRKAHVLLLRFLLTPKPDFFGVNDHHKITRITCGVKIALFLPRRTLAILTATRPSG
jgi:hypothetical protein